MDPPQRRVKNRGMYWSSVGGRTLTIFLIGGCCQFLLSAMDRSVRNIVSGGTELDQRALLSRLRVSEPRCDRMKTCFHDGAFFNGTWLYEPNKTRTEMNYITPTNYGKAQRDFRVNHTKNSEHLPFNRWGWHPEDSTCCYVKTFDRLKFCQILNKLGIKSMTIVGDSISQQQSESLYMMVDGIEKTPSGVPGVDLDFVTPWTGTLCASASFASEGVSPVDFTYMRNDLLYVNTTKLNRWWGYPQVGDDCCSFYWEWFASGPWVQLLPVDLLIVNAGAHIHNDVFYKEIIRRVVDYLKDHQKGRIVYRNTHIGHPNCYDYPGPVLNEDRFPSLSAGAYQSFTWDKFDSFNVHADEAFRSLGAKILETDRMTRSRFDGHVNKDDCMHYFLPSVVDWWNVALYNLLEAELDEQTS